MDEDFDKELEELIKDAMDERDEGLEDDGSTGKESGESGEGSEGDSKEESEEDNSRSSGDGNEDEHQEANEQTQKLDFEPIEVEVAGVKVTINSKEEMLAYIKKGASTFNTEPEKFTEEKVILEQGKVSAEDLKLLVDAKNGSKEALALLARKANIDILDVESEMADDYTQQTQYYQQSEVDKVADEILSDTELASEFKRVASALPQDFMSEVTSNARDLKAFSGHIKSGIAQEVIPLAINSQIVNGGTFLENYNKIGQALAMKKAQPEVKREVGQREQEFRKRASSGSGHNSQSVGNSGKDIWDMSDEDFDNLDLSSLK
jgi:hypothetical protein